jgi:hypothetical protein
MSTGKVVLIVGGVAVGAFVLLKMLAPSPLANRSAPKSGTDLVGGINGILGAAGAFKGLFSSGSSNQAAAVIDTPSGLMATRDEWKQIGAYDAQGTADAPVFGIAGLDY